LACKLNALNLNNPEEPIIIGILGWETGDKITLAQLEQIQGNIAHPETFDFPVLYKRVKGACYETIVVKPGKEVLVNMIASAREMEKEGIKAIMGNCGFNALFQRELADAVNIPLYSSSLLQVPMVRRMLKKGQKVGLITADQKHLTQKHFQAVGIDESSVCVAGIEHTGEFGKIRSDPYATLDVEKFKNEVVEVASQLFISNPEMGAIVLECTDLPPFAAAIRQLTGLPVFDIVTLAYLIYEALSGNRWVQLSNYEH